VEITVNSSIRFRLWKKNGRSLGVLRKGLVFVAADISAIILIVSVRSRPQTAKQTFLTNA